MKRAFLFLLVITFSSALGGCTEMSPDDREFYGRGWIHPGELDRERPTQMPAHPETAGSLGGGPIPGSSSQGGDPIPGSSSQGTMWTPGD